MKIIDNYCLQKLSCTTLQNFQLINVQSAEVMFNSWVSKSSMKLNFCQMKFFNKILHFDTQITQNDSCIKHQLKHNHAISFTKCKVHFVQAHEICMYCGYFLVDILIYPLEWHHFHINDAIYPEWCYSWEWHHSTGQMIRLYVSIIWNCNVFSSTVCLLLTSKIKKH